MAPHSSTLAWKIPWMEEPGRLQSMGSLGVRHDWATSLSLFTLMHWRRKWGNPLQYSCLENPTDWGAWQAAVYGVAQSRTRLKRLSSSSSSSSWIWACPGNSQTLACSWRDTSPVSSGSSRGYFLGVSSTKDPSHPFSLNQEALDVISGPAMPCDMCYLSCWYNGMSHLCV